MNVLIIEDERELAESIFDYLQRSNFNCETAQNVFEGMERITAGCYDCILLDISLPDGNGFSILQELQRQGKSDGVFIISAKSSLDDKINGLNLGADDYLTKPFHLAELSARITAFLRRKYFSGQNLVIADDLVINLQYRTVQGPQGAIDLTKKEQELLLYFVANKEKVLTKDAIVEHLWGHQVDNEANYVSIYSHVKNLRKKLVQNGCSDYIKAVYGIGYCFSLPANNLPE